MERGYPITIGVALLDQSVSGFGDPLPLVRIAEARYRLAAIGEIRVESDVVLVRGQNIIVRPRSKIWQVPGSRQFK